MKLSYVDSAYRKSKRIYRTGVHVLVHLSISMGEKILTPTLHHKQKLIPGVDLNMKSKEPKLPEDNI